MRAGGTGRQVTQRSPENTPTTCHESARTEGPEQNCIHCQWCGYTGIRGSWVFFTASGGLHAALAGARGPQRRVLQVGEVERAMQADVDGAEGGAQVHRTGTWQPGAPSSEERLRPGRGNV